ncbi:MAG: hypothetical protein L3J96_03635, partial [Thermoplasmata archaeon]|nr:hypothetical protein [Thermoplasmata archaeon]
MNGTPRAAREVKVAAPWRLGKRTGAVAAVSVAFLFLATSFAAAQNAPASLAVSPGVSVAPGVTGTNAVVPAVFSHPTASITPAHRSYSPAFGPPSSGRGTFLNTSLVPLAPSARCAHIYVSYCVNSSWDPSINYTSNGFLAVAYMDLTNQSPCASASPYAISEIGFTRSANLGATWSAPIHLGL